jgi:hypothetical protein
MKREFAAMISKTMVLYVGDLPSKLDQYFTEGHDIQAPHAVVLAGIEKEITGALPSLPDG